MSPIIFIVGKSDPQLASVHAIKQLGYRVGIFTDGSKAPKHPDAYDIIMPLDFSKLDQELSKLDALRDAIAGLVCTYENYVTSKATLTSYLELPGMSSAAARMATDKYLMRQAFMAANPSITPRFQKVTTKAELLAFAASTTYPLILKPTNLVKSLLVLRCNTEQELLTNFAYAQSAIGDLYQKYQIHGRESEIIIEEFIKGKSCSIAAFVDGDGTPHFCDSVVAITPATERGVDDNYLYSRILPADLPQEMSDRLFNVAAAGIKALDMRSVPAHVELMYDGNDVKIIEIGARIGGYRPRMYQASYGLDLTAQEVRLAIGEQPELRGRFKAYSAVFELFPVKTGKFKEIRGAAYASQYAYYSVKSKPNQLIGPAKHGFKAAAVIMIIHENKAIFDELCQTVNTISVEVAA
ncbi:MAG TPA: ATP-grasp domain-containing protein [Candidatus Saccharimonadales bacterium]|nr:ATP-grasp domain-containing protein [Candidatus Saccharimonadales bacterium]